MNRDKAVKILSDVNDLKRIIEYVQAHYTISANPKDRELRGHVQNDIATALNFVKSPSFHNLVKTAFSRLGCKNIRINSYGYYKFIKKKES